MAKHLILGEAGDLDGLAVPLVDKAMRVDAEDGRVRRVDEQGEIVRDARELFLTLVDLGDILTHTHHADDGA